MTYRQAVNILDAVRLGADYPESVVTEALKQTGDLDWFNWPDHTAQPMGIYKEVA